LGTKDKPVSVWKGFRRRVEGAGLAVMAGLIPRLPRSAALGFGGFLGWLAYVILAHDRAVARANLDIAFGDVMPRREKRRLVRLAFHNAALNAAGLFWAPRLSPQNIRQYAEYDEASEEWFRQIKGRGKGVILVTPHYGDWELMSLAAGFAGAPYTTIMEPTKNPALERTITRLRSLSGHSIIHPRFAVVKLFKAVSRGETVAVLIDVNARRGRGGVWLDFFGLQVFNTAAVAELAMRTGAAIVFAAAHPLPGRRTRIQFGPEIEVSRSGDHERDVQVTSQRCLDECAKLIREKPDSWLWTYKRWKRRPTPEKDGYPFYSKYDANT